ncbi:MAG TPA: VCBS repeat-containing protein [Vicinamibacteria bacterium]|nr:VCBS repeat-containing protein [Vicinamibacteria bacterium]
MKGRTVALVVLCGVACSLCASGCRRAPRSAHTLALGLALFTTDPEGHQKPDRATAGFLAPDGARWRHGTLRDGDSNVFHKVLEYCPQPGSCGLLTLGGSKAEIKLWRPGAPPTVVWQADFGGRFSRMRDAEVADVMGDGVPAIVVATHDQGVVTLVRPESGGGFSVKELDRQPDTFVHEIEVGDLDGDGVLEIYATPSAPNKLDGTPQAGAVVRYVPRRGEGRKVVAALGNRHAKEILVTDLDGDGKDELYVSVEAVSGGEVEVRRYLADTPPTAGQTVAVLPDRLCRCLTAGDVDGDGRREIVAATAKAGLWLLRPGAGLPWKTERIAADSSGFEHAALLADLDGDGRDELYVASDEQNEVRQYVLRDGAWQQRVLYRYPGKLDGFTWNLTAVRTSLVPPSAWE